MDAAQERVAAVEPAVLELGQETAAGRCVDFGDDHAGARVEALDVPRDDLEHPGEGEAGGLVLEVGDATPCAGLGVEATEQEAPSKSGSSEMRAGARRWRELVDAGARRCEAGLYGKRCTR